MTRYAAREYSSGPAAVLQGATHTRGSHYSSARTVTWGEPYRIVVIANRDGTMDARLIKDAANMCQCIKVGNYLVTDGEKQNEQLFEADGVDVDR
jgi:tRNA G37 N-methylase TrmD